MKCIIKTQIETILQKEASCYIDKRENGYRMKFPFMQVTKLQIEKILKLPHIIRAENISSFSPGRGMYDAFCIWFDCRPSSINWNDFDLNIKS